MTKAIVIGEAPESVVYLMPESEIRQALTLLRRDSCEITDVELEWYKGEVRAGSMSFMFDYMFPLDDETPLDELTEEQWIDSLYYQNVREDGHSYATVEVMDLGDWEKQKPLVFHKLQKRNEEAVAHKAEFEARYGKD